MRVLSESVCRKLALPVRRRELDDDIAVFGGSTSILLYCPLFAGRYSVGVHRTLASRRTINPHDVKLHSLVPLYHGDDALAEVIGRWGGLGSEAEGGTGRPVPDSGYMVWK